jgi:hypothetical protein
MKSEGCAPEQFPFQAFVNSSDYQLYMVITAKKKSKNRVADPTKNNPYLSQKTEKNGGHCTCPLIKKKKMYRHLFIHHLSLEKPCLKKSIEKPQNSMA